MQRVQRAGVGEAKLGCEFGNCRALPIATPTSPSPHTPERFWIPAVSVSTTPEDTKCTNDSISSNREKTPRGENRKECAAKPKARPDQ